MLSTTQTLAKGLRVHVQALTVFRQCRGFSYTAGARIHNSLSTFDEKEGDKPPVEDKEATEESVEEGEEDEEEEEEEDNLPEGKLRKATLWFAAEGKQFEKPVWGQTNYVYETPFPMNPLFKPSAPVSDYIKEEIFKTHTFEPLTWTPRKLATKYGLSLKRVEAIIKLKAHEREMVDKGFSMQTQFRKGMESMMGVDNRITPEPIDETVPRVSKPFFKTVDEDIPFTPVDAAKVLKRKPFQQIQDELQQEAVVKQEVEEKPRVIAKDPSEATRRWKFMFTDTNKKLDITDRKIWVRERDGTLREATRSERQRKIKLVWSNHTGGLSKDDFKYN
ncbi:hypothetical protein K493DRAFT_347186 [Basidiobolus meristosporus CBS 931.73]|uniref:37S ribosomal protein S35, mitochondrial n=1 Tax=Basidiobolus meristosporus CBS 931.73 TaxID=1314790 RepID=A0A1Y1YUW5_9FUNG|nr:hypothetical protein K493DRAFT_347186 [Basidiobolus meristosporus CBS 931.73]|eukprot:ORY01634.1 hypothetical protein K493DRAFT_347186 [Basidiobolus meristosporus CBS 931.73]